MEAGEGRGEGEERGIGGEERGRREKDGKEGR